MADNKENQNNGSSKSNDSSIANLEKNPKEVPIDILTQKAKESKIEFGSAGHDDINKNLGSFGNTVVKPDQSQPNEIKLDVDAKIVEKASKEKIDFERFKKTRKAEKAAKTKFGEKVSIMLHSKKGLRLTWILELVIMVVVIAISATLIGLLSKYKGYDGDGPLRLDNAQKCLKVGLVFAWISLFPCFIPLIYLVTTWFVGINQVSSSRLYHYMFWICGLVAVVCFIIGFGLLMVPANAALAY